MSPASTLKYDEAVAAERRVYDQCLEVHNLPAIFHYWSNRHLLPQLEGFGFSSVEDFFANHLTLQCKEGSVSRFVSLGSGNCDLEIELAGRLRSAGLQFRLECVDLNPLMLERGRLLAREQGLDDYLTFTEADLNAWKPGNSFHAVIANQSLHHVVNLEGLFEAIKASLEPGGTLITADMIGRNGHQRWPEALAMIQEFWRTLPPSRRLNRVLNRYEEWFLDWDCSGSGFEGIRSQDILPLLSARFHFHLFLPFGNLIDPFTDRSFGHYFDPASDADRAFIDAVHDRDERELAAGTITPTHMFAVLANEPAEAPAVRGHLTPEFCIRPPHRVVVAIPPAGNPHLSELSPEEAQREISLLSTRLASTEHALRESTAWALRVEEELRERTEWALQLDRERQAQQLVPKLQELEAELILRTEWALQLDTELADAEQRAATALAKLLLRNASFENLEQELEDRTAWAFRLDEELVRLRQEIAAFRRNRRGLLRALLKPVR